MQNDFLTPEGLLDKAEIIKAIKVPMLAKGMVTSMVEAGVDAVNTMDLDHDGKADIVQHLPKVIAAVNFAIAVYPYVQELKEAIDFKGAVEWLKSKSFVKSPAKIDNVVAKLEQHAASEGLA